MISSDDVAKILGVNVATVKRWTDSGKLDCVKTAGGHRKFLLRHLAAFAMEHEKYAQRLSLLPLDSQVSLELSQQILNADLDGLVPQVLDSAIHCDQKAVKTILEGLYMVHQDLAAIYDGLLTPVLHRIGEMWMEGKLSITEEHLASQTIRDGIIKLQDVVIRPESLKGKAFVLTLSSELHDIPAKMVQHLLEVGGFQVLYSGQKTPAGDTVNVFETFKPDRVYLSSTYIEDVETAQQEFNELTAICKQYGSQLFCGGAGVSQLTISNTVSYRLLTSFQDVQNS